MICHISGLNINFHKPLSTFINLLIRSLLTPVLDCSHQQNLNTMIAVEGIVLQENKPVFDAVVSVVEGSGPFPDIAALTDNRGAFSLQLPPGRYRIRAFYQENQADAVVELRDEQPSAKVTLHV